MIREVTGYRRDASWHDAPDTTVPKKLHRDDGHWFAACAGGRIILDTIPARVPGDSPALCRRRFPGVARTR